MAQGGPAQVEGMETVLSEIASRLCEHQKT
jgi:hypothetical protein